MAAFRTVDYYCFTTKPEIPGYNNSARVVELSRSNIILLVLFFFRELYVTIRLKTIEFSGFLLLTYSSQLSLEQLWRVILKRQMTTVESSLCHVQYNTQKKVL